MAEAEQNVELFRKAPRGEKTRTIMSTFACVGCHQR
jgi:cytochrome c551/c552